MHSNLSPFIVFFCRSHFHFNKNVTQLLNTLSSIRLEQMYNGVKTIAMNESLVNNNTGNKNNIIITNYDNYYYSAP